MTVYADTSFFVSLYGSDVHSTEAHRLIGTHQAVWFTPLHHAEWLHAIGQHVFRKQISLAEALQLQHHLDSDRAAGVWEDIGVPDMAFDVCAALARRYGARLGVRTLDSLHVASALELKAKRFWTFDDRQAALAQAEGLQLR